jgi:hypothetical protein
VAFRDRQFAVDVGVQMHLPYILSGRAFDVHTQETAMNVPASARAPFARKRVILP